MNPEHTNTEMCVDNEDKSSVSEKNLIQKKERVVRRSNRIQKLSQEKNQTTPSQNNLIQNKINELKLIMQDKSRESDLVCSMNPDIYLNYSSLKLLFEDQWLNSDVIDFFMLLFSRNSLQTMRVITSFECSRFKRTTAFQRTKISNNLQELQQRQQNNCNDSYEIVLMSVNWSNQHWGLMGYYCVSKLFFWYEPANSGKSSWKLGDAEWSSFHGLLKQLKINHPNCRDIKHISFPCQNDGWSCGLRVIYLTKLLSRSFGSFIFRDFHAFENHEMRDELIYDLVSYLSGFIDN